MSLPIIGIITHDYLKEKYFQYLRRAGMRIAIFVTPSSLNTLQADFAIPVPRLDLSADELTAIIDQAEATRGIHLSGLISLRDGNVIPCAEVCRRKGWIGPDPVALAPLANKFSVRQWLQSHEIAGLDRCPVTEFPPSLSREEFHSRFLGFLESTAHGEAFFKPSCGSCKAHVLHITQSAQVHEAYSLYQANSDYRGGHFIMEEAILGEEFSVESLVDGNGQIVQQFVTGYLPADPSLESTGGHYERGHTSPAPAGVLSDPQVQHRIRQALQELHSQMGLANMITHIEMKVHPRSDQSGLDLKLIEINPRAAGDMILHLHALVHGVSLLEWLGCLVLSKPFPSSPSPSSSDSTSALIRFFPPAVGQLKVNWEIVGSFFRHAEDLAHVFVPEGTVLCGGDTNDDRTGLVFLVGDSLEELAGRSARVAQRVLSVHRSPYLIRPN